MKTRIIILSTGGHLLPIYEILQIAYPIEESYSQWNRPGVDHLFLRQRVNGMLSRLIESCRVRNKVLSNLHGHVNWFCSCVNLPPYPYHALTVDQYGNVDASCKLSDPRDFRTIVKDLAMTVLFQLEEFGLYNETGILEYEYLAVNDLYFNEIALKRLPQLITQEPPNGTTT